MITNGELIRFHRGNGKWFKYIADTTALEFGRVSDVELSSTRGAYEELFITQ